MVENVRPDFYAQSLDVANYKATGYTIERIDVEGGALTGTNLKTKLTFKFNTMDQCVDLFKSRFAYEYAPTFTTPFTKLEAVCASAIKSATLYVAAKPIRTVTDWSRIRQASIRGNYSKIMNNIKNDVDYRGAVVADANSATGSLTSYDFLDAFFMKNGSLILPPGCEVKIEVFTAPANGVYNAATGDATDSVATIAPADFYLQIHRVKANGLLESGAQKQIYVYTIDMDNPLVDSTAFSRTVGVEPGLVKLIIGFQDTGAIKSDTKSIFNAHVFDWTTSGLSNNATDTKKLNTLQVRYAAGTPILGGFKNTRNYSGAYLHFLTNTASDFKDSQESQTEWEKQGALFVVPIAVDEKKNATSVLIEAAFSAIPGAYMYVFKVYEKILRFTTNATTGKTSATLK